MDRQQHLEWCKKRALECLDDGDLTNAYASMVSDLNKHPETENHPAIELGFLSLAAGHIATLEEMRRFIEGFN